MKNNRMIPFVKLMMQQNDYMKSEEIIKSLSISARTLRDDLAKYKQYFQDHGIVIESKHGTGYRLVVVDENKYYDLITKLLKEEEDAQRLLPVYPEDRITYLIKLFLSTKEYVKLDDIADQMFISRSTLQSDMKEVKERLQFFHIDLISKPGHGLKIEGSEMHLRSCISQYFFHTETMDDLFLKRNHMDAQQSRIRDILFDTLNETDFRLTDIGFQNLIIHISIALLRIHEPIKDSLDYGELKQNKEYQIAQQLIHRINEAFDVHLEEVETFYITIHLMGKKTMQYHKEYAITQEIETLLEKIFKTIMIQYGYDFSSDFELYTVLALHFQPMLNRLRYGLMIQNPLLDEIKQENTAAFEIAVLAAQVIEEQMSFLLSEAEIGYLALHFALAMERVNKQYQRKKNILIVCASGAGSSQILLYKIKQRFKDYLDKTTVIELYKLKTIDQTQYDLILSTVPIPFTTSIPVIQVQYFLNGKDAAAVYDALKKEPEEMSFVDAYFKENLFFKDIKGKTKEAVLHEMITRCALFVPLPKGLEESILEREQYASTEFGNMVAMPHPMKAMMETPFVAVAVLPKPIRWHKQQVRYVFLMCMSQEVNDQIHLFHETISALVFDKNNLQRFEKDMSIKQLKGILNQIVEEESKMMEDDIFR
ncbi:BglG family transcription antiterminator [[Eubacterium] hominis]|uniref:BglG family transcription antiterminator n=1 Tax=[Eubacterium] hominis TaxID=2764325 RepID=UPI003A4D894D